MYVLLWGRTSEIIVPRWIYIKDTQGRDLTLLRSTPLDPAKMHATAQFSEIEVTQSLVGLNVADRGK